MAGQLRVGVSDYRWLLNDQVTCPGAAAEGLLMNVRMVNATFEDRNRDDFDPDANTDRFIEMIPDYAEHGVRAFTFCLQGGMPGYEGALNTAFEGDGSLRPGYTTRVARAIEACDAAGVAVILSFFYQRQMGIFDGPDPVRAAVVSGVRWVAEQGFTNVVVEIANEYAHNGFVDHQIVKSDEGQVELIQLAKETAAQECPDLLVSTAGMGSGRLGESVAEAVDFIIIHFNNTDMADVPDRIEALKHHKKPILCNEDTKVGKRGAEVASLCVEHGCSWGLMQRAVNQHHPFAFDGAADDPEVYARLRALTTDPKTRTSTQRR